MKRVLFFSAVIFFSALSLRGQSLIEIDRPFSQIVLRGAIVAEFVPSNEPRIEIQVNGTNTNRVVWSEKNGRVTIMLRVGIAESERNIVANVKVFYHELTYLGVEGAHLSCETPITSENLLVETLGGVNRFDLAVATSNLEIVASGDSRISFHGRSGNLDIKAYMGARVDCAACETDFVMALARQKSEIVVRTSGELHAESWSGSNIFYLGSPTLHAKARLGSGIISVDETPI